MKRLGLRRGMHMGTGPLPLALPLFERSISGGYTKPDGYPSTSVIFLAMYPGEGGTYIPMIP
jgi:hypothetical protein